MRLLTVLGVNIFVYYCVVHRKTLGARYQKNILSVNSFVEGRVYISEPEY
jgi:hypothetical protein